MPSSSSSECTESTSGNWYNGYWKQINNLVGADAEIETKSPELDCEPTGDWYDGSIAWVGVTQKPSVSRWPQVGWWRRRENGSTTIGRRIYFESKIGPNAADYHLAYRNSGPGAGLNRYTCNMIWPSDGEWYFYYNSVGFGRWQHDGWKNTVCNWYDMFAETHHKETRCAGTPSSKCNYDDCRYRTDGNPFTSVDLVASDSYIKQPEAGAFDQELVGSTSPIDSFRVWDTRA